MKNFVSSVISSLIIVLLSSGVIFLLEAPLISFVYYGFFSTNFDFGQNVISKVVSKDSITLIIMMVQTVLTLSFIFLLFIFISRVINIFLKNEKLVKPYYMVFFFMMTIVPVVLIFLSIIFKVKLIIPILIIAILFMILTIVISIFSQKILPNTTDYNNRKYLFTKDSEDE